MDIIWSGKEESSYYYEDCAVPNYCTKTTYVGITKYGTLITWGEIKRKEHNGLPKWLGRSYYEKPTETLIQKPITILEAVDIIVRHTNNYEEAEAIIKKHLHNNNNYTGERS